MDGDRDGGREGGGERQRDGDYHTGGHLAEALVKLIDP